MKLGVEYLNLQSPLRQRLIVIETTDFFVQDRSEEHTSELQSQ